MPSIVTVNGLCARMNSQRVKSSDEPAVLILTGMRDSEPSGERDSTTGGRASSVGCTPLLVALAAEYRPALRQLKRHGGFLAALRTSGGRHAALLRRGRGIARLAAPRFARLTSFGLVSEALLGIKELLAGAEYKIGTALDTPENPVPVLHIEPPFKANMLPVARVNRTEAARAASAVRLLYVNPARAAPSCERACELEPL